MSGGKGKTPKFCGFQKNLDLVYGDVPEMIHHADLLNGWICSIVSQENRCFNEEQVPR
jgi:hypothetical protein